MAINKVVYGGRTLIDLTGVTVTPEVLLKGYTAYDASGNLITGTYGAVSNLLTMDDGLINKRFGGSGTVSNASGHFITDYFGYSDGGLRIVKGYSNISGTYGSNHYGNCRIAFYDENKTFIAAAYIAQNDASSYMGFTIEGDDLARADLTTFAGVSDWSAVKFIRLTLALNNAASAIGSVSDVLNSGMAIYAE